MPRPVLDGALEPVLSSAKPRNGYFPRAESLFNVAAFVDSGGIFSRPGRWEPSPDGSNRDTDFEITYGKVRSASRRRPGNPGPPRARR